MSALRGGGCGTKRRYVTAVSFRLLDRATPEYGGPGYENVCSSRRDKRCCLRIDPAVYLQMDVPITYHLPRITHFVHQRGQELLSAKPWVDCHDEDEVNRVEDMLQPGERCCHVQRDTGLLALRTNRLK